MKLNFVIQLLGKAVPMKQSLQPKRQSPSPHHRPSLPRSFERHSYRSATIGSTLIARRAGDQDAKSPSKAMAIHALTITSGSRGCISYTTLEIACPTARARVRPTSDPRTSSAAVLRSEEHTSELQSRLHLVCRLLLEKKKGNHSPLRLEDVAQHQRRERIHRSYDRLSGHRRQECLLHAEVHRCPFASRTRMVLRLLRL